MDVYLIVKMLEIKIDSEGNHLVEVIALVDDRIMLAADYDDQPQGEVDRRWWMELSKADKQGLLVEDESCAREREQLHNITGMWIVENPPWFLTPEDLEHTDADFPSIKEFLNKFAPEFIKE